MLFIFSLAVAVLFSFIAAKMLRKHPWPFYIGTILLCTALAFIPKETTGFFNDYILNMFRRGTIGTALFVVVMYMATLKNGSKAMKTLMPIRGQLSIMASIMCLCHNIFFGRTYFIMMFTMPGAMSEVQLMAGVLSIILIVIMVPLFIMSFPAIRKKMNPKKWKKIQRMAYLYYGLLYVHIMVLMIPGTVHGYVEYAVNITVYSIVFAAYAVLRLRKTKIQEDRKLMLQILVAVAAACVVTTGWNNLITASRDQETEEVDDKSEAVQEVIEVRDTDAVDTEISAADTETGDTDTLVADTEAGSKWKDGTYTGKGTGYGGKILVDVDIVNGMIADIRLQENKEDEPYRTNAMAVIDTILKEQTYEVDAVSGATSTSEGIITGVRRALKEAEKAAQE